MRYRVELRVTEVSYFSVEVEADSRESATLVAENSSEGWEQLASCVTDYETSRVTQLPDDGVSYLMEYLRED